MEVIPHVMLTTYLTFIVLALAWLHRDMILAVAASSGLGPYRLAFL